MTLEDYIESFVDEISLTIAYDNSDIHLGMPDHTPVNDFKLYQIGIVIGPDTFEYTEDWE